jgi:RHS repeat-associated protein
MKAFIKTSIFLLSGFVLLQKSYGQSAPNISYPGGTFTYSLGDNIDPLNVYNSGGATGITGLTTTFAGTGYAGYINSIGTSASFNQPLGIVADPAGNIYVTDVGNEVIRKITPSGSVSTFAGSGIPGAANGTGASASFYHPLGMCADAAGNIYVADENNNIIRKITPTGVVTTIGGQTTAGYVDGSSSVAKFNLPCGVAVDAAGNVYVADYNNNAIRKIATNGTVSTFAGNTSGISGSANGTGTAATFNHPISLTIDGSGNLYVADRLNHMIRVITPLGAVTTLAGQTTAGFANGAGSAAQFDYPTSITVDKQGNVYVADELNNRIRMVTPGGVVTTLSGTGTQGAANGIGASSTFYDPFGITTDGGGRLYVCDYANNDIREVISSQYIISPALPTGITLNVTTGSISGSPTVLTPSTNYTVTAYNNYGTGSAVFNLTVNPASINFSAGQNCVVTYTPRIPGIQTSTALNAVSATNTLVETNIQYLDGLGRPLQTVQYKGSPANNDVVQPYAYDQLGRDSISYLPYSTSSSSPGAYEPNALTGTGGYTGSAQFQFYQLAGQAYVINPYPSSALKYEPSPLNRVVEKGAPGAAWQLSTSGVTDSGHTIKVAYLLNNSTSFTTDPVKGMQAASYSATINSDNSRTLVSNGFYSANTLTVTVSEDENWASGRAGTVEEYKDMNGSVVLKRVYNNITVSGVTTLQMLSTYYVYDDFGYLAFVLPPISGADAGTTISAATLANDCYQYWYDQKGRLIQKNIPGRGWEYIVYNSIDQPVATQTQLQLAINQWMFTKYDELDRPILTGIWNNSGTRIAAPALQLLLNPIITNLHETAISTGNGYTDVAWPTTSVVTTYTLDYYDNYAMVPNLPAGYIATSGISTQTRSLPTVKKTTIVNTPANQLWDVIYYDNLGRPVNTFAQHYFGGTLNTNNFDQTSVTYNFTNQPTTTTRKHWNVNSTSYPQVTIYNKYIYDQVGRKVRTWQQMTNGNNTPDALWLISQIVYDEIGQLQKKQLHSADSINFYQTVSYNYNERGWLLKSNAPLFEMQLQYNGSSIAGIAPVPQYNGNIASQSWGTNAAPNTSSTVYSYDNLNRLTAGNNLAGYSENNITYDVMGNITGLNRYIPGSTQPTQIDQLAYTYIAGTNILQTVADGSGNNSGLVSGTTSYVFDVNGNLKSTTNTTNGAQNKSFAYDYTLNLPLSATIATGSVAYTYDAAGNKLRKVDVNSTGTFNTDYVSGIQYTGATGAETISFIQTEEGRAIPNGATNNYEYYLGDNLGNTRITFDTGTGVANQIQKDDYYPFGMDINTPPLPSVKNEYLYNGKELQEELGVYDYNHRFYDPLIGRFTTIDPLAEQDRRWSPYNYTFGDPIRFTDPDGMWPNWGDLGKGVLETVGGAVAAVGGVVTAVATGVTVVGAAGGITVATLGVATTGFGVTKIVDSFRPDGQKAMNIPSSAPSGIVEGASKKLGLKENTTKFLAGAADLAAGGKPKNVKDMIDAGGTVIDMMGNHSGNVKKSGMQQDHTKTPAVKPEPVSKPEPKPEPKTTVRAANASGY